MVLKAILGNCDWTVVCAPVEIHLWNAFAIKGHISFFRANHYLNEDNFLLGSISLQFELSLAFHLLSQYIQSFPTQRTPTIKLPEMKLSRTPISVYVTFWMSL